MCKEPVSHVYQVTLHLKHDMSLLVQELPHPSLIYTSMKLLCGTEHVYIVSQDEALGKDPSPFTNPSEIINK